MTTLANFPVVSQLTSITSDKRPSENAQEDCVPASIGACILWYEHKSQWDSTMNPDLLKDMAYGEAYRNDGTAAIKYIPICEKLGYKLYSIDGTNAELVQKAHQLINPGNGKPGQPTIFTEPDPYSSNPGDSHVCVFFSEASGTLTALDPYIAKAITRTDGQWQSMLLFGQLWTVEKIQGGTVGVPANWHDDGTTLTAPNGIPVVKGFRSHVLANHWDGSNWPLEAERGTDQLEGSNPSLGSGTEQIFRWKVLEWSQKRGVFEMWTGQELLFTRGQVAKYYTLAIQMRDYASKLEADLQAFQKALPQS